MFLKKAETVKYHNRLNSISMRGWSSMEMNIFFAIVSKVRDKGTNEIIIDSNDLRNLSDKVEFRNKGYWFDSLKSTVRKLVTLYYYQEDDSGFEVMALFSKIRLTSDELSLIVAVSSEFSYIVNQLTEKFTSWELQEFTSLRSSYSKTLYRLLKQWRFTGERRFTVEELKRQLDIPESYNTGMIHKRVIEKSLSELSIYFKGLDCRVEKSSAKGTPVTGYIFTFDPELKQSKPPVFAQKNSKKKEIIPYWVENQTNQEQSTLDAEEQEKLREQMKQILKKD